MLILAISGAVVARQRRWFLLLLGLAISVLYTIMIGGDTFPYARFLAHEVPVLLVLAAVTRMQPWSIRPNAISSFVLLALLSLGTLSNVGTLYPGEIFSTNGSPKTSIVAGVLIDRYASSDATVAVISAGIVPYFGRRISIDMLGKSDPVIARLEPVCCPTRIGHNKFDVDHSLGLEPDFVVPMLPHKLNVMDSWLDYLEWNSGLTYNIAIVSSEEFRQNYLPNPVEIDYLFQGIPVYARGTSSEALNLSLWTMPQVSP